jgi:trk system potassium uptake protein
MPDDLKPTNVYRPKPGNRILRITKLQPFRIITPEVKERKPIAVSLWALVWGFALIIAVGTIMLTSPISSKSGEWTPFVDSLFTSTSAVCVTGLVVVDTLDHWNYFGQGVIAILIQLGGLGFVTSSTILIIAARRRIGLRDRILISESAGVSGIGGVVRLTRNIVIFTLATELVGAAIFYLHFSSQFGPELGAWKSVFQAISAFNNAGFDLFGGFLSLTGYHSDPLVLLTTAALVILGGISFVVLANIFNSRGIGKSSVDTKLVLMVTFLLLAAGTLFLLITEFNNPNTLGPMTLPDKILNAFFHSVTPRTSGFNSIDVGAMAIYSIFFTMVLMFIGGAAGSTAGGIKVNTFGMLVATVWYTVRGREYPGAFGREFQSQQIYRAITLLVISLALIILVFVVLSITENFSSYRLLFETISAFGTVGLTTGVTPDLSVVGRVMIILTMFIGRLGPLTLMMVLARLQHPSKYRLPQESIRIG